MAGQVVAALIVAKKGYKKPPALGLYYKWQTFFFIPLGAMQTCIVPVVSFNYVARNIDRCKKTLSTAIGFGMALMAVGTLCFNCIPAQMLRVFTPDKTVIAIGRVGFHFVGLSFIPMVTSLIFPVFFQAVGKSLKSSLLTVIRTVVLFVPLGFLLVEDNKINQMIALKVLKKAGFEVDVADDGTVAVEKVRGAAPGHYDLILMDIQMPIMNGPGKFVTAPLNHARSSFARKDILRGVDIVSN